MDLRLPFQGTDLERDCRFDPYLHLQIFKIFIGEIVITVTRGRSLEWGVTHADPPPRS